MSTSKRLLPSGDSQRPRIHVAPRADETNGDLAANLAASYDLDPDSWQRFVLDDWLAMRGGKWSSLTCGLSVPRQNGKNALLEVRELFGMVGLGERILHTAHEVKTAQKHFRRLKHFFGGKADDPGAKFPELNALVESVRSVNGQEAIFLKNGGSVEVVARSKNSGRGFTVDVLVMDEAQEMAEDALEALMPTTSAAPLGNPQWIFTGTPPGPSAVGEVFTRVRAEALSDHPGRLSWHEWSVQEEVNLDDRVQWRMTNPAIDAGRLQETVIEGERARFSDGGFARERLGQWPLSGRSSRLVSADLWARSGVESAPDGVRSLAVAFNRDGSRVSTAGSVKHADGVHAELVAAYSGPVQAGISQLAEWIADRWEKLAMIALLGAASAPLYQALVDRGVPRRVLHTLTTSDYFAANAMTLDALGTEGMLTHPAEQPGDALAASVAVSDMKKRGQSGQWGWEATTPDGDETPIEAFSVAYWAARTAKRKPGRKQVLI